MEKGGNRKMDIERKRFEGVQNILSFNRHFFIFGVVVLALIVGSKSIWDGNSDWFWTGIIVTVYGLSAPLIVSWIVYDLSGFHSFKWLEAMGLEDSEQNLNLNIHAGLDETSQTLTRILPKSKLLVYDFYRSDRHTEPAIVRARKVSSIYPNTQQISSSSIPLDDNTVDTIFLLLAIHEIRNPDERDLFLRECRRVCKSKGRVIMVEHLRDLPNFMAFNIGFMHFFSRSTWTKALNKAGFEYISEAKFTPFLSIFNCIK